MLSLGLICGSFVHPTSALHGEVSRKRKRGVLVASKGYPAPQDITEQQETHDGTKRQKMEECTKRRNPQDDAPNELQEAHECTKRQKVQDAAESVPDDSMKHNADMQQGDAERAGLQMDDEIKQSEHSVEVKSEGTCSVRRCILPAQVEGKCQKHYANKCIEDGCQLQAQSGKKCRKHAGVGMCSEPECTKAAAYKAKCILHAPRCIESGCKSGAVRAGQCSHHRRYRKTCSQEGCESLSRSQGKCAKHAPHCKTLGCTNTARMKGGLCRLHSPQGKCNVPGCENLKYYSRGRCKKHRDPDIATSQNATRRCNKTTAASTTSI